MATDYDDMALPTGMMRFASLQPARGGLFSARQRLQLHGEAKLASPFTEDELVEDHFQKLLRKMALMLMIFWPKC